MSGFIKWLRRNAASLEKLFKAGPLRPTRVSYATSQRRQFRTNFRGETPMTHEQLVERIKNLLALATGEGNEHEKRLALQRAQELMARYSISIADETGKPEEILRVE